MSERQPYATAPKDGRFVQLGSDDGEGPFLMRWEPDAVNPIVGPQAGLWVLKGGGLTWCDRHPDGAPTYWMEETPNAD